MAGKQDDFCDSTGQWYPHVSTEDWFHVPLPLHVVKASPLVKSPNLPNLVAIVYLRVEHTPNKNCQKMVLEKRQESVETTSIGC